MDITRDFSLFAVALTLCTQIVSADELATLQRDPLSYEGPARAGDSVWMIDTTAIEKASPESPGLRFKRYEALGWQDADLATFAAEDATNTKTVVFVHGYDYTSDKAERVGWAMYHTLATDMPKGERLRMVTWCWPSTGIKFRMLRDMRVKMRRANAEAYFLAWFLSRADVDTVIGTAMGCRIVSGSFQLLAGELATLNTDVQPDSRRERLQAVLISAAIADDWLQPDALHGKALSQVNRVLLLNNSLDPMLANFGMVTSRDDVALGVAGLATESLGDYADRLSQHDAANAIGEQHGVENYLRSPETSALLREFVLVLN